MSILAHHRQKIVRTILALDRMADQSEDEQQVETLRDAAFYLLELAVKITYPKAQSLIEVLHD